jgi:hypothetical protein
VDGPDGLDGLDDAGLAGHPPSDEAGESTAAGAVETDKDPPALKGSGES